MKKIKNIFQTKQVIPKVIKNIRARKTGRR